MQKLSKETWLEKKKQSLSQSSILRVTLIVMFYILVWQQKYWILDQFKIQIKVIS